jgi:uncharacterized protein
MQAILKHYTFSLIFMAACLGLAAWYGLSSTGTLGGMAQILWIVFVLSILEISLSFDNAVVNASVLKEMDEVWQRRFLTWGIAFAVFGMRIVFPLAIVAIAANVGPIEAAQLSLNNPREYERLVSSAHVGIAGFGGAFLAMVGLKFFFDRDKDVHWIRWIEEQLSKFAALPAAEIALLLLVLWGISSLLPSDEALTFVIAGILGLVTFIAVEGLNTILEISEEKKRLAGAAVRSGLGGFLYLNVLDASFSFDGVIGAFALSNNMVIIALGLSIGAMFVRSMTIHLVRQGTLAQYRFLALPYSRDDHRRDRRGVDRLVPVVVGPLQQAPSGSGRCSPSHSLRLHVVLLEEVVKRWAADPEQLGSVRDVPLAARQRLADHAPIGLFARRLQVEHVLSGLVSAGEVKVIRSDQLALCHDDGALDPVFQLADVARPGPGVDGRQCIGREALDLRVHLPRKTRQEVLCQQHGIARPLGQSRDLHDDFRQAVEQVLPKTSGGNHRF